MATIKKPIRIGDDTPLRNFQANEAVGPDHGGTGIVASDLAGQAGKVLTVNGTEDGWTLAAGGGGGGDSLGTGFTSGGGSGSIPDGTEATLGGEFQIKKTGAFVGYKNSHFLPASYGPLSAFGFSCGAYPGAYSNFAMDESQFGFVFEGKDADGRDYRIQAIPGNINFGGSGFGQYFNFQGGIGSLAFEHSNYLSFNAPSVQVTGDIDMSTTSNAFKPPRLYQSDIDALTPGEGWLVYNLDVHKMQVFDGTVWQNCW